MSDPLATCPGCGTCFRVTREQLAMASGAVRCGACLLVFTVEEELAEVGAEGDKDLFYIEPEAAVSTTDVQGQDETNSSERDSEDPPIEDPVDAMVKSLMQDDGADLSAEPELVTDAELLMEAEPLIGAEPFMGAELLIDAGGSNTQAEDLSDKVSNSDLESEIDADELAQEALDAHDSLTVDDDQGGHRVEESGGESDEESGEQDQLNPLGEDSESVTEELDHPNSEEQEEPDENEVLPSEQASELSAEPSSEDNSTEDNSADGNSFDGNSSDNNEEDAENPDFALEPADPTEIISAPETEASNWIWTAMMVLLVGALVLQYVWFNRSYLAQSEQWRPYFLQGCQYLPCELSEYYHPEQLSASNLLVRSHPELQNILMVDALIKNSGRYRQQFPKIRLVFTDKNNQLQAGRDFSPKEYLAGEMKGLKHIPANTEVRISLEIRDPGLEAIGYAVQIIPKL